MNDRHAHDLAPWQRERVDFFSGIAFERKEFAAVKDPCDREHCWICQADILAGDAYWASVEPGGYELCVRCYDRYRSRTSTHWDVHGR